MHQFENSNSTSEPGPNAGAGSERESTTLESLSSIGWDQTRANEFSALANPEMKPARVARVDGRTVLMITEEGTTRGESSSELLKNAETTEDLPSAGDWVGYVERPSHDSDLIEAILPRRTVLARTRTDSASFARSTAVETQVIATNLDVVFVVHAANNVNVRRLEREAAQVAASGAEVVIVLNKADLCDDIEDVLEEVTDSLLLMPVHAVSGVTGDGVESLSGYAKPDRTVAFIGASGVGKSTLTNRLLGRDEMDTGAVREDDQRGRHTTTARHLIPVPGGGALIDTPGMRSLGLSGADQGVDAVFEDITELALTCRFNDCSHVGEPDCAVQEAISNGELTEKRLASFRKLSKEMEFIQSKSDISLRHAKRDMLKARTKGGRKAYKAREKFGRAE